ncbi:MAG: anti-sigma factor domain-containing protein [Candidatus Limnocylindria bacterium]
MTQPLVCTDVDELAAAHALGSLPPAEAAAVERHLATCREPHAEVREAAAFVERLTREVPTPVPPPALRSRIIASAAAVPQESAVDERLGQPRTAVGPARSEPTAVARDRVPARWGSVPRWRWPSLGRLMVGASLAAAVVLAFAVVQLQGALNGRDDQLNRIAGVLANGSQAVRIETGAARGYLVRGSSGSATLVMTGIAPPPAGKVYEMWLLDARGRATPAGLVPVSSGIVVAPLDAPLTPGVARFVLTVERARVSQPTGKPILVADISG